MTTLEESHWPRTASRQRTVVSLPSGGRRFTILDVAHTRETRLAVLSTAASSRLSPRVAHRGRSHAETTYGLAIFAFLQPALPIVNY